MKYECENCGRRYNTFDSNSNFQKTYCSHKCEREVMTFGLRGIKTANDLISKKADKADKADKFSW